ncbi:hypothetical protein NFX37_13760 [Serratia marcescens]|nr:hypothetical protein NFX37_13760 [Serratia marcescens]
MSVIGLINLMEMAKQEQHSASCRLDAKPLSMSTPPPSVRCRKTSPHFYLSVRQIMQCETPGEALLHRQSLRGAIPVAV